jgi:hypothetical protein
MKKRLLSAALIIAVVLVCEVGCQGPQASATTCKTEVIETHWPNGRLRRHREVIRKPDGTLVDQGRQTTWHDNGNKAFEAVYVDGKIEGVELNWHKNGQMRTKAHFEHGIREGSRYTWDEEGHLRKEEHYCHGKPHGTWTIWKKDGSLKWQATYDHGIPQP